MTSALALNESATFSEAGSRKAAGTMIEVAMTVKSFEINNLAGFDGYLSVKEGSRLLGLSTSTIKEHCKKGKYTVKLVDGNGGKQYRILLESLPEYARLKWAQENTAIIQKNSSLQPLQEQTDLAGIDERQMKIANARFELVKNWKQHREKSKLALMEADKQFEFMYLNMNKFAEIFNTLEGDGKIKTLFKWAATLKENNNDVLSLAPNYNYGAGTTTVSFQEAEMILKYLLNQNQLRWSEVIRSAQKDLRLIGIEVKSSATYRRWIETWKNQNDDVYRFSREGYKSLNDGVLPYLMRDRNMIEVGDVFVIDGHKSGYTTINPATGKAMRMTKIVIYDMKSDMPVGLEIMPSENVYALSSALRRAILFLGRCLGQQGFRPRAIYIDNGRANKSKWFIGDLENSGINGLIQRMGIKDIFIAEAYHGQSKNIERFFGTSQEMERHAITYTGTSIESKPARLLRNEKFHQRIHDQIMRKAGLNRTEGIGMTIEEDYIMNLVWFEEYIQRVHQDGFYKGLSPMQVFMNSLEVIKNQPDFIERIISTQELHYMMLEDTVKTLYRNGIKIGNKYYWNDVFYPMEKGCGKHSFKIKYDIDDDSYILVYENGKYLCTAYKKNMVDPAAKLHLVESDMEELKNQLAHKKSLAKSTVKATEAIYKMQLGEMDNTVKMIHKKAAAKSKKKSRSLDCARDDDMDLRVDMPETQYTESDDDIDLNI